MRKEETDGQVATWMSRVKEEVTKIKREDKQKQRSLTTSAWRSNRDTIRQRREAREARELPRLIPVPHVGVLPSNSEDSDSGEGAKKRKFARLVGEKGKKTQATEIMTIPAVATRPDMNIWAPIRRNVLTEDDQYHSNIPYFGDEAIGTNFIRSFEDSVKNGVKIFDGDDDDSLFLTLVNNLSSLDLSKEEVLSPPNSEDQKKWHLTSTVDKSLPGLTVFQAIASQYPDCGSVEELIKKFRKLNEVKSNTNLVPDIDGPNVEAISAERAMHSYKSLLCRRCFKYDCPLHNDPYIDTAEPRVDKDELAPPTTPCGEDCFLHISTEPAPTPAPLGPHNNKSKPVQLKCDPVLAKTVAKKLLGEHYTKENLENWNNSEITLFRMLVLSFPGNYCAIGQCMITKTCKQVYLFSKQEEPGNVAKIKKKPPSLPGRGRGNKAKKKVSKKTQQAALYKGNSKGGERENKYPYTPCHHPGQPCNEQHCSCIQAGNFCEKFCYCPTECVQRFPGCKCKSKCSSNACSCFLAKRECDPDLCNSCLDGKLEFNRETNSCRNVMIQRELGKKMYIAPSDIAGWGCFIGEKANKNDFIAEYVGEMISQEESERRGKIYDKAKCSYMFNLNEEFCIDAARMGGKIRFANHSSKPNCTVKILIVNGDHRIGIYANKEIQEGEELFFNYGKDFHGHDIV